jgi:hypothetical protein
VLALIVGWGARRPHREPARSTGLMFGRLAVAVAVGECMSRWSPASSPGGHFDGALRRGALPHLSPRLSR